MQAKEVGVGKDVVDAIDHDRRNRCTTNSRFYRGASMGEIFFLDNTANSLSQIQTDS
ncbi:MAG: hypothetical protein ACK5P7_12105 [Bdellovibrio sp.]